LLPSASDPILFVIRCKEGKEKKIVVSLMTKFEYCKWNSLPINILSASASFTVPGHIYVEAFKECHVRQALEGIDGVFHKIVQIPKLEMP